MVYLLCFEFGEFFYKLQIFDVKKYETLYYDLVFLNNLKYIISFIYFNRSICSYYSFLFQLNFQTWLKYLKEINFLITEYLP